MGKAVKVFSIKLQHFAKIRCNWVRKMGSCMSFGSNEETQNESIKEKMASTNVNIRVHKEKRNDLKYNLLKKKLPKRIRTNRSHSNTVSDGSIQEFGPFKAVAANSFGIEENFKENEKSEN